MKKHKLINNKNNVKKELNVILNEMNDKHNYFYDYSLVDYKNNYTKIKIICPTHGMFEQSPRKHLSGQGCSKCGKEKTKNKLTKTNDSFKNEANIIFNYFYDYSLVDYENNNTKIKIICPTHGVFEQLPSNHLSGKGCIKCSYEKRGLNSRETYESFSEKSNLIHSNYYDYSLVEYETCKENINIICPKHGVFEVTPDSHINKSQGCVKCNIGNSKTQVEINYFLSTLGILFEDNNRVILNGKELDIYIPSHNIAIEFNGLYWHSELYKDNNYHLNKTIECEKQGIKLIHIFEDEWLHKQDIVKSRLMNILGLTSNKIYARKTVVREIDSTIAKKFCYSNHIQGYVNSKYKIGLYYDGELVSVMLFNLIRKNKTILIDNQIELVRFCNKLNTSVIGGADKLLKYFIKTYKPKEITSYADRRWSQGDLYNKLGFTFVHHSKPNYSYIIGNNRKHKSNYKKSNLIKDGFDGTKTEHEIMLSRSMYRIYDCGLKKYVLKF
jgi:hypothetical protein